MQINSNSVFYSPVTTEQRNNSSRLPVVIDATRGQSFQKTVSQYRPATVADSNTSHIRDYQQAQFIHASARVASSGNAYTETKLPKAVQHYLQISAISDAQNNQSSGLIDEKV